MDILCGGCGRTLTVDDGIVRQDLPCPYCGRLIRISALEGEGAAQEDPERLLAPLEAEDDLADDFLTKARLALKKKLLVVCGSCGERLTVQQRLAGKVARCPACGKQIRVPAASEDDVPIEPKELMTDVGGEQAGALDLAGQAGGPAPQADADVETAVGDLTARPVTPWRIRRRRLARRRSNLAAILLLACVATGLGGVLIGYVLWGRAHRPRPPPPPRQSVDRPPPGPRVARVEPTPGPVTRPPETRPEPPPASVPVPPPSPPKARAEIQVTRAKLEVLNGKGLVPAPAGGAFLLVEAKITASEEPVEIDTAGVALRTPGGEVRSLGVPPGGAALVVGGQRKRMIVAAKTSRAETFLFVVPSGLSGGTLVVAGAGEGEIPKLQPLPVPSADQLAGSFAEAARFLKLSFDDPIMEEVRSAPEQRLVVQQRQGYFDVSIPPTGVHGRATPASDGTHKAVLTHGEAALTGWLRLTDRGRRLVLYLAEEPYHQVVYERQ